jgi:hypothetical protein
MRAQHLLRACRIVPCTCVCRSLANALSLPRKRQSWRCKSPRTSERNRFAKIKLERKSKLWRILRANLLTGQEVIEGQILPNSFFDPATIEFPSPTLADEPACFINSRLLAFDRKSEYDSSARIQCHCSVIQGIPRCIDRILFVRRLV